VRRLVSIDGRVVPPEEATVTVYDRGFLYGDAVFETLRTYRGVPHALGDHLARLARSAARLLMRLPMDEAALAAEVERAFAAAREHPEDDGYARIVVTRGAAPLGLDVDLATRPRIVVYVEPLPPPRPEGRGMKVATVATLRAVDGTSASGAKVTNYVVAMLALAEAKKNGAEEALLVDARGRVIEGTTSNVFVVKDGAIATPPEEVGLLAGITRAHVLALAPIALAEIKVLDLYAADEVFITSSIREVVGVSEVDGRSIGAGAPGPVTRRIRDAYRATLSVENASKDNGLR
jgi:branched-chain amino acid aminotransferase